MSEKTERLLESLKKDAYEKLSEKQLSDFKRISAFGAAEKMKWDAMDNEQKDFMVIMTVIEEFRKLKRDAETFNNLKAAVRALLGGMS